MYHKYWVIKHAGGSTKELLLNPNAKENWSVLVYGTEVLSDRSRIREANAWNLSGTNDDMPELFLLKG